MSKVRSNVIAVGKLSPREFSVLPPDDKKAYLKTVAPKERLDLILSDPDVKRVTASLGPQGFFWLYKEVGEADAADLLQYASAEQLIFMLDMELWEGWTFSQTKACHWLSYFLEGGKPRIHELLKHLDFEFLLLFLARELVVGGGIGDLAEDEESFADYDHTFDNVFWISFKNPKHSRLIGSFLSMIIDLDKPLYTSLMEGVKGGVDVELEEQCLHFRTGRLQDLGFPPLEEALAIYARVNPASFEVSGDKELHPAGESGEMVPFSGPQESLLFRALSRNNSPLVMQELNYLVNSALIAEGEGFLEQDTVNGVLQRVYGYLNIALEHLSSGDEVRAAGLLRGEELKRLFQLGFSIVLELKFAAVKVETADYASGKVLAGLKSKRPRFYRGLDPDGVDGYREFKSIGDVKRVAEFLSLFRS